MLIKSLENLLQTNNSVLCNNLEHLRLTRSGLDAN